MEREKEEEGRQIMTEGKRGNEKGGKGEKREEEKKTSKEKRKMEGTC